MINIRSFHILQNSNTVLYPLPNYFHFETAKGKVTSDLPTIPEGAIMASLHLFCFVELIPYCFILVI
jgi:hypothetical protein